MAASATRARLLAVAAAVAAAFVVPAASPAQVPAQSAFTATAFEHRIIGRVIAFEPYHLRLDRGPAQIVLHRGTVIRPRGLTLQNGMPVRVYGHIANDGVFSADEIDLLPGSRPPVPPPGYARY
jgi:hypothetical protein